MNKEQFEAMMTIDGIANKKLDDTREALYHDLVERLEIVKNKLNNFYEEYVGRRYWKMLVEEHFIEKKFSNGLEIRNATYDYNIYISNKNIRSGNYENRFSIGYKYSINNISTGVGGWAGNYIPSADQLEQFAYRVSGAEKLYESLVDAVPEIYQLIADIAHKRSEKRLNAVANAADICGVKTKEKKITRVVIEIEEV